MGRSNAGGVRKSFDLQTSRFISKMIQDRATVTMECQYEIVRDYQMVQFPLTLNDP